MHLARLLTIVTVVPITSFAAQRKLDLTGRPEGSIGEPFTLIAGVHALSGDRAVVTDQMDRSIALVDFSAGTRRTVGTTGDGPGEYRFLTAPLAAPGGTTWLYNPVQRRMHVLSADGRLTAATLGLPGGVPGGIAAARGTDASGHVYFESASFDAERSVFLDSVAVVRWNPVNGRSSVQARVSNHSALTSSPRTRACDVVP